MGGKEEVGGGRGDWEERGEMLGKEEEEVRKKGKAKIMKRKESRKM